YS
ncbi:DEAD/DEAH box helicase family protein, partial [Chlamydia psittaci 84-8471/1]